MQSLSPRFVMRVRALMQSSMVGWAEKRVALRGIQTRGGAPTRDRTKSSAPSLVVQAKGLRRRSIGSDSPGPLSAPTQILICSIHPDRFSSPARLQLAKRRHPAEIASLYSTQRKIRPDGLVVHSSNIRLDPSQRTASDIASRSKDPKHAFDRPELRRIRPIHALLQLETASFLCGELSPRRFLGA